MNARQYPFYQPGYSQQQPQAIVQQSPRAVFHAALDQLRQLQIATPATWKAPMKPPVEAGWRSNLYPEQTASTGQLAGADTWAAVGSTLAVAGTGLGAYHGYRRTGSLGWAIAWAILGGLFPIITIPVAIAQGFGQRSR